MLAIGAPSFGITLRFDKSAPMIPNLPQLHPTTRSLNGKTPAEACGIKVEGKDKWLTLIQNASKKSQ
jgi:hypothetical protein